MDQKLDLQNFAPIVLFGFNRVETIRATVDSLKRCCYAQESELFIFIDGPRSSAEKEKVQAVRDFVCKINGFKNTTFYFSETNKGLGDSIISGISDIINIYGKVIVLEDDLILHPQFLSFMNSALNHYESVDKVFSICGYTNRINIPSDYKASTYFCTRSSSWGWGTWADRWNTVDWELDNWTYYKTLKTRFNKWGGSDCFRMLRSVKEGWGNSWAIRFGFAEFLQDKLSLFPVRSLCRNNGFDGNGTNCKKYSRFKYDMFDDDFSEATFPPETILDKRLYKSAMSYHSLAIRIWSRIMYIIYR